MTRSDAIQVVVCAGGLGTRIAGWARYVPKEFYPVDGRPGIVHLLEEIAQAGPAEVVIVCHPYYDAFTAWAHAALSQEGHDSYTRAARLPAAGSPVSGLTVRFIPQRGPYADLTSVLNGADHLAAPGDLYVLFADNRHVAPIQIRLGGGAARRLRVRHVGTPAAAATSAAIQCMFRFPALATGRVRGTCRRADSLLVNHLDQVTGTLHAQLRNPAATRRAAA